MSTAGIDRHIGRFYTRGRIIRLDELGPTFVVRLVVMRLRSVRTIRTWLCVLIVRHDPWLCVLNDALRKIVRLDG